MGDRQMGGDPGRLREEIAARLIEAGFAAVGFAAAEPVDAEVMREYDDWLAAGMAAEMGYLHNHREIREDPRLLLEGARSIICMAYDYTPDRGRDPELPVISEYALLPDYHDFLRKLIRNSGVGELLGEEGRDWRICVDSAPIMERYWAEKAGIGTRGRNGMVVVPGVGSKVFLAEIVTTTPGPAAEPRDTVKRHGLIVPGGFPAGSGACTDCGACLRACPDGALSEEGRINCNRCLSYLTIEHRGEWKPGPQTEAMLTPAGRNTLFGCDRCITVCPLNHNREEERNQQEERNRSEGTVRTRRPAELEGVRTLTVADILEGDADELKARIQGSCLKRAKSDGLARNAYNVSKDSF